MDGQSLDTLKQTLLNQTSVQSQMANDLKN